MLTLSPLPKWSPYQDESTIFSVRSSFDNNYIAASLSNGKVILLSSKTGRLSYTFDQSKESFPATSVRFHPINNKAVLAVSAEGSITEWLTGNKSQENWTIEEPKNQIYSLDIDKNGAKFATGGLDKRVRLYDYEKREVITEFFKSENDDFANGHTNRIFSLLFHPNNPNLLISGGWDDTLQFWDIRTNSSLRSAFGPHICGDAMDAFNELLVTGSWRTRDQIQLFDLRTFTEMKKIRWSSEPEEKQALIYTVKFHSTGDHFFAAGSGDNKIRIFSTITYSSTSKSAQFDSAIYSVCLSSDSKNIVIGTEKGCIHSFDLQYTRK